MKIKLVQDSFRQVAPIAETAAQLFYARLFELDPDLELLFKGNLSEQGRKLMQMPGLAVNSLDRMDQLLPVVRSLGTRHVNYARIRNAKWVENAGWRRCYSRRDDMILVRQLRLPQWNPLT